MEDKNSEEQEKTKFQPTTKQWDFLKSFLQCKERTITGIAKDAGVERTTIYEWRKNPEFVKWFRDEVETAYRAGLPEIYKSIKMIATGDSKDKMKALELYLKRFDIDFLDKHKVELEDNVYINFVPADAKT